MENRQTNKQYVDCLPRAVGKTPQEYGGRRHELLSGESGRPERKIRRTEPEKMSVGDRVHQAERGLSRLKEQRVRR